MPATDIVASYTALMRIVCVVSGWGSASDAGVTLPEYYYGDLWQLDMSQKRDAHIKQAARCC